MKWVVLQELYRENALTGQHDASVVSVRLVRGEGEAWLPNNLELLCMQMSLSNSLNACQLMVEDFAIPVAGNEAEEPKGLIPAGTLLSSWLDLAGTARNQATVDHSSDVATKSSSVLCKQDIKLRRLSAPTLISQDPSHSSRTHDTSLNTLPEV